MKINSVPSFNCTIYIAGNYDQARQICREHCFDVGLCVTVKQTTYIYSGGEESGVEIGLINYPRFPCEPDVLKQRAEDLGILLMERLCQQSFTIVSNDETIWYSRREQEEERLKILRGE